MPYGYDMGSYHSVQGLYDVATNATHQNGMIDNDTAHSHWTRFSTIFWLGIEVSIDNAIDSHAETCVKQETHKMNQFTWLVQLFTVYNRGVITSYHYHLKLQTLHTYQFEIVYTKAGVP